MPSIVSHLSLLGTAIRGSLSHRAQTVTLMVNFTESVPEPDSHVADNPVIRSPRLRGGASRYTCADRGQGRPWEAGAVPCALTTASWTRRWPHYCRELNGADAPSGGGVSASHHLYRARSHCR